MQKKFLLSLVFLLFFCFNFASAQTVDEETFYIDPNFSEGNLNYTLKASLISESNGIKFYIDNDYWQLKSEEEQKEIKSLLKEISERFKINRAKVVSIFGSEKSPGIDNDPSLTVLLYDLKGDNRGYVRTIDTYEKIVAPFSNQREMVYLDVDKIDSPFFDSFLIHEYTHLITFNQRPSIFEDDKEVWLSELYSEYAASIIESNPNVYSYLDQRVRDFFKNPSASVTAWDGDIYDYASVLMFAEYIVDQYGQKVLKDALKSTERGMDVFTDALQKNGFEKTIEGVFRDWIIALAVNDCSVGEKYCYKNVKLKNFTVFPFNNFLPYSGETVISIGQSISNWSGQWQKFSGGAGDLTIDFDGEDNSEIKASYIAKTQKDSIVVGDLELNEERNGQVVIPDMDEKYQYIVIAPFLTDVDIDSNDLELSYRMSAKILPGGDQIEDENTLQNVLNLAKPLQEMSTRELLILLVKVLLLRQGYEI